jgi:hypothetical protein
MSDDEKDLFDQSLPGGDPGREGWLLKFVLAGVLVMLLYGVVTLFLAAGVV